MSISGLKKKFYEGNFEDYDNQINNLPENEKYEGEILRIYKIWISEDWSKAYALAKDMYLKTRSKISYVLLLKVDLLLLWIRKPLNHNHDNILLIKEVEELTEFFDESEKQLIFEDLLVLKGLKGYSIYHVYNREEGINLLLDAISDAFTLKSDFFYGVFQLWVAQLYLWEKNYEQAMKYINEGGKLFEKLNNRFFIIECLTLRARICLKQKDNVNALSFINQGIDIYFRLLSLGYEAQYQHNGPFYSKIFYLKNNVNDEAMLQFSVDMQLHFQTIGHPEIIHLVEFPMFYSYYLQGNFDEALKHGLASLNILEENYHPLFSAFSMVTLGIIYQKKGEFELAITILNRSLQIRERYKYDTGREISLTLLANLFIETSDFDLALQYYEQCLPHYEKIKHYSNLAGIYRKIGLIHKFRGQFYESKEKILTAQQYYQMESEFFRWAPINSGKYGYAATSILIGEILEYESKIMDARNNYEKALEIGKEINHHEITCEALFRIILLLLNSGSNENLDSYLQDIEKLSALDPNPIIDLMKNTAHASILMFQPGMKAKSKSQELFKQISQSKVQRRDINIIAKFNICELLILELKAFGEKESLNEAVDAVDDLLELAKKERSHILLIESFIFKSKLCQIKLELNQAEILLENALELAEKKDINFIIPKIKNEIKIFHKDIKVWKQFSDQNIPLIERILQSDVGSYMQEAKKLGVTFLH